MTFERLCLIFIAVVFVGAEAWRPTHFFPKKNSAKSLILSSSGSASTGYKTELDTDLLNDLPRIDALPFENIDAVITPAGNVAPRGSEGVRFSRKAAIRIVGWLADSQSRTPGAAIFPIVDGRRFGNADIIYGVIRPDVGRFFRLPALDSTGFALLLPGGSLAPGRHRVVFGLVSSDRRGYLQASEALLLIASQ